MQKKLKNNLNIWKTQIFWQKKVLQKTWKKNDNDISNISEKFEKVFDKKINEKSKKKKK